MYKSREDEYQRQYDVNDTPSSYGYDNNRPSYQDDIYDEDDFYGQIMRNASRNNPYRNIQPEPQHDYGTNYEASYEEPRRSRMDTTSHLPRMEEPPYPRHTYQEREERSSNNYQKPVTPYLDTYAQPAYPTQNDFKQPARTYERTSQFTNTFDNTASLRTETPYRRSHMQEDVTYARQPQINAYTQEETIIPRRRNRQIEEPQSPFYGSFREELMDTPKKAPMTLSEEYESQRKSRRNNKKKDNPQNSVKKVPVKNFKQFVKQNVIIFVYALVNCVALSFVVAGLLYTQIIKNYVMPAGMQKEMITLCLQTAPILAYQVAGFHCGYFMFKGKLSTMKPVFKVILSPIFFVVFEVIGIVCEIPYLIYAMVKMGDE